MNIPSKLVVPFFSAIELVEVLNNNDHASYSIDNIKTLVKSGGIRPCLAYNPAITAYLIINDKNNELTRDKWINGHYSGVYIPSFREEYDREKGEFIRIELPLFENGNQITAGRCSISRHWYAKEVVKTPATRNDEDKYFLESIDLPFSVAAVSDKFKGWPLNDFVFYHDDVVRLIENLKEEEQPTTSAPEPILERQNESEELKALLLAQETFWTNYDPTDPTTAPTKALVVNFLVSRGIANSVAEKADTILRGGRRRPN